MARVTKIDNAILKRQRRAKEREERRVGLLPERKYFLLFCEGARTEPNYFLALAKHLPRNLVQLDIDPKGGLNTISLVNHAINSIPRYRKKYPNIDYEVWIVFDKDSFPDQDYNNAVTLAGSNGFKSAHTNEAFELWYLLHFEFYNTGISRTQYKKLLTRHLGKKYEKNDPNIYNLLNSLQNSDERFAIKNANKLLDFQSNLAPAKANPTTQVHKLIIELNKFNPNKLTE